MNIEPWILATALLGLVVAFCSLWWGRRSAGKERREILSEPDSELEPEKEDEFDRLENVRRNFVANVSHELRTPVAIVKGFAETLDDDYDELSGKKRREFIGKIRKNSDRLCSLVEDLLQLAELESPSQALSLENGYLDTVAKSVAERFEEQLDQPTQTIQLELAQENEFIRFDPVKIERVIENLLDNALRYARNFSVITIRTIVDAKAREIRCEVEDDGCGIPEKDLRHLFERFYRVDKGRSRESGGTGLGLSIVKHVVELHGGTVIARSEMDKGSTFSFTLPYRS